MAWHKNEPTALAVTVQGGEEGDIVALAGEFDFAAAPRVSTAIDAFLAAGRRRILIDLDAVTFVDGAAIGALIGANEQTLSVGGTLEVVTEHALCLRLLRITEELQRLTVHPSTTATDLDDSTAPTAYTGPTAGQMRSASAR